MRLPRTAFAADGVAGAPWTAPPGEMQTSDGYPSEIAALRAAYRLATAADEDTCRCAERAQGSNLVCLTVQSRSNLAQISLPISLRYHSDITPISLQYHSEAAGVTNLAATPSLTLTLTRLLASVLLGGATTTLLAGSTGAAAAYNASYALTASRPPRLSNLGPRGVESLRSPEITITLRIPEITITHHGSPRDGIPCSCANPNPSHSLSHLFLLAAVLCPCLHSRPCPACAAPRVGCL